MDVVIYLLSDESTEDAGGEDILEPVKREVFAERLSVRQSEFYQAHAVGFKPEIMFKMRVEDYQDEELLEYDKEQLTDFKRYSVMRAFETKYQDYVELICFNVVNQGAQ